MNANITSIRSFLDQMLTQGRGLAQQGEDLAANRLGVGDDPSARRQMRSTALAGGAAAGVLGLLLGSGRGRRMLKTGAVVGGLGLLGKLAYDAYTKGNGGAEPAPQAAPISMIADGTEDRRARTLAAAMIAAAKSDGHIDDKEQAAIEVQLTALPVPVRAALTVELMRAPDPAALAAQAQSDQERREIYVASVMMTGADTAQERTYLAALSRALNLDDSVVAAIHEGLGHTGLGHSTPAAGTTPPPLPA